MAQKRGKRWQGNLRLPDGRRRRPYFETKKEAEAWEATARLALERGEDIPDTERTPGKHMSNAPTGKDKETYSDLGAIFDYVVQNEWRQMRASAALMRNGRQVCDYFGRGFAVSDIKADKVAAMKRWFLARGLQPSSVNRRLAALSKMLKVARELDVLTVQPVVKWCREEQTRFRYVDEEEEAKILAYWASVGDPNLKDITVFLIDTGARWSEMASVRWEAFGPEFTSVTFWATKSGKPRTVPLTKRVRVMLSSRRKRSSNSSGPFTHINRWSCVSRWNRMRTATGLGDVTFHTLRHTCCTRLVLGGVDVKRVMEWMGHSAIVTTLRYMQIRPSALEDALAVLE